ncbi:3-hydroxyacyl-CoA dehydrogenase family protein [Ruminococcaceae bacterium OttesenSCG-928-D13]|nr:3-hydroxyacyl-CoA dehydrogenase family protein [Ruminococcaceae bacterium OttesenSCG-928-D13]
MAKQIIAIAGAGTMGASIAQVYAQCGHEVVLYDLFPLGLGKGKDLITLNQETAVAEGKLTAAQSAELLGRIHFTTELADFARADFVIEAILERMDVKHAFWAEASSLVRADAILTSNTSGLSLSEIATAVIRPERFCGMHWINPPHIVPLVEVIKGDKTSDETAQAVYESALAAGKKPVMVQKDAKGFVLNRLQFAVLREAMHIVENGIASPEDVDNVFKYGLGMRYAAIGPFETADLGGLDVFYNIASYLLADLSDEKAVPELLAARYQAGDYGVKSGRGFYDYSDGKDEAAIRRRDKMFLKLAECLYGGED